MENNQSAIEEKENEIAFTKEDIEQKRKKAKLLFKQGRTLYVENMHWRIYGIALVCSIILIGLYFTSLADDHEKLINVSMSVGSGLIGAIGLAGAIDIGNGVAQFRQEVRLYNELILSICVPLRDISTCRPFDYLSQISEESAKECMCKMIASQLISELTGARTNITRYLSSGNCMIDDEAGLKYRKLDVQLRKFIATLQSPYNVEHQITSFEGIRQWLKTNTTDNIENDVLCY